MTRASATLALLATCAALGAACGGPTPAATDPVDKPGDHPFPAGDGPCDGLRVLRVAPWTGGGLQLTVAFDAPPAGASALTLTGLPNQAPTLALATPPESGGYTGVVLVPSADAAEHAARVAEAAQLVRDAPAGDRVIAWLGTTPPALLADATRDRDHVLARLEATAARAGTLDDPGRASVLATLDRLGGPWGPQPRDLRVVGGDGDRVTAREGLRTVGVCGPFPGGVKLELAAAEARCTFTTPAPDADMRGLPCDPTAAAYDAWPWPDTVALRFDTAAARTAFDALEAAASEDEFDVTLTLGTARPVDARAHFRGQSSLGCKRKNLAVNLGGATPRRLTPGAADDELLLVSLCLDSGYVNQALANRLMRGLDLMPLNDRFVSLSVDGEPRGVYLLLQKPVDTLRRDLARLAGVIRRRFDPENKPEDIDFPDDEAGRAWVIDHYHALTARVDEVSPTELMAALAVDFDLDGYLRWLALASYLHNGDFVDEVFFYASDESAGPWFRMHGWDSDDLFTDCHHQGRFAFEDPHGLTFCMEGDLDRALLVSDAVYDRYVDVLEALVTDEAPPGAISDVLDGVRADLVARLGDDATCRAMTEVGAADCAGLVGAIDARVAFLKGAVQDRAEALLEGIAAYRTTR